MGHNKRTTIGKKKKELNYDDRRFLDKSIDNIHRRKVTNKYLAETLHCSIRTIQRELKRGITEKLHSELFTYYTYSAETAQRNADFEKSNRGPDCKIGYDRVLALKISSLIENKYSPDAVVMHFNLYGWPTQTRLSTKTIYRYIQNGILEGISDTNLLRQGLLQRKTEKTTPQEHKRAKTAEKSIDNRPKEIEDRSTFGH